MAPKTRPDPNVADPLSEPTVNRRLWAAYLQRGFTRADVAKRLEVSYQSVDSWDTEKTTPSLDVLVRASQLVQYSMDELCFGHHPPKLRRAEGELSRDAIKLLLVELGASSAEIEALGEHEQSPAGRFQRFTRTYVGAFVGAYRAAVKAGCTHKQALDGAKAEAAKARASVDAVGRGIGAPVTTQELREMGERIRKTHSTTHRKVPPRKR